MPRNKLFDIQHIDTQVGIAVAVVFGMTWLLTGSILWGFVMATVVFTIMTCIETRVHYIREKHWKMDDELREMIKQERWK